MHLTGQVMNYSSLFVWSTLYETFSCFGQLSSCAFPAAPHVVTSSIIHLHFVHFQNCKVVLVFPCKVQRLINNIICCQLFFMIGYHFYQLLQANYFHTYWTSFLMTVECFKTKWHTTLGRALDNLLYNVLCSGVNNVP